MNYMNFSRQVFLYFEICSSFDLPNAKLDNENNLKGGQNVKLHCAQTQPCTTGVPVGGKNVKQVYYSGEP